MRTSQTAWLKTKSSSFEWRIADRFQSLPALANLSTMARTLLPTFEILTAYRVNKVALRWSFVYVAASLKTVH